jgi:hypothetical protein
MTSYGWAWVGTIFLAVLFSVLLIRRTSRTVAHWNVAVLGAVLEGVGIGLVVPAEYGHSRTPLEGTALALGVIGLVLYLIFGRQGKRADK